MLPPMWTEDGMVNGKLAIGLTVAVLDVNVNFLPFTSVASAISFTAMVLSVLMVKLPLLCRQSLWHIGYRAWPDRHLQK